MTAEQVEGCLAAQVSVWLMHALAWLMPSLLTACVWETPLRACF